MEGCFSVTVGDVGVEGFPTRRYQLLGGGYVGFCRHGAGFLVVGGRTMRVVNLEPCFVWCKDLNLKSEFFSIMSPNFVSDCFRWPRPWVSLFCGLDWAFKLEIS